MGTIEKIKVVLQGFIGGLISSKFLKMSAPDGQQRIFSSNIARSPEFFLGIARQRFETLTITALVAAVARFGAGHALDLGPGFGRSLEFN